MNKVYKNLMVDLETLDMLPTAVITSIAAVAFDIETGEIGPEFMYDINIQDCIDKGLTVSSDTLLWWFKQSDEARFGLTEGQLKSVRLDHALFEFSAFIESLQPSTLSLYGNSARFDLGILHNAHIVCKRKLPWKHTLERDVRTLVMFNPEIKAKHVENFKGVRHNPIDDCKNQIEYCVEIYNSITVKK